MTPPLSSRSCTVQLTCDLSAPRASRSLVALLLRQWGVGDTEVLDAATLVVSELVTNVLVHCDDGGPVVVTLELTGEQLRVQVEDRSPVAPAQRLAEPTAESGRGLGIVAQLAVHWGVEPLRDGKRVVVHLPVPSVSCA